MNKNQKIWLGIGIFALVLVLYIISAYNSLVKLEVSVDSQWAKVEADYQRRMDLIPNLVETVKGYASHEETVFTEVTKARSAWTSASTTQEKMAAANGMESAISRLLLVAENYPDLKASENFLALQSELANTENKISVERKRYNDKVSAFNKKIRTFPSNMVASMFGFEKRDFFKSQEGAENAPKVEF